MIYRICLLFCVLALPSVALATTSSPTANSVTQIIHGGTGASSLGQNIATNNNVVNVTQPADRNVSSSPDTITSADCGRLVVYNSGSAIAVSIAAASTTGLTQGCGVFLNNIGAGAVTVTPTTSTINGAATFVLPKNTGCYIRSNSVNYLIDFSSCTALSLPLGSTATTPADNATCTAGQMWWDTGFIYVCTASGTVKRAALSTF